MPNYPIRYGILGTANIARALPPALAHSKLAKIIAVASRSIEKAEAFANEFNIEKRYASYEAILNDGDIDAIYIPLPNSMHAEWALKAIAAGKHVLCEKPLALNLAETKNMVAAAEAKGVALLEAFPFMFQPQTQLAVSLIESGKIGKIQIMQASFGFHITDPNNIRYDPALGGGALLDAGCYPVSFVRMVMGEMPARVTATARWHERGVDTTVAAIFDYADGRIAQISCGMQVGVHRRAMIVGSDGVLETDYLNSTSAEMPGRLLLREGTSWIQPAAPQSYECGDGFMFESEAFAKMIVEGDLASLKKWQQMSLDNAATLEAIINSAKHSMPTVPVKSMAIGA